MSFVVPAVLVGVAIAVMALVSAFAGRRARASSAATGGQPSHAARVLVHSINDDRCTGCDACVAVCPTNVLDLVDNKSRVLRFQDCIQCEACMWACPTTALVMHPEGSEPPAYKTPELDEHYQTKVAGQYLIGEVAGKPLVKNAANLGRAVVEHMLRNGLQPSPGAGIGTVDGKVRLVDVAIVGSGPGGLSAALTCIQRGLSYVVLEKENVISSTVSRYPKGKLVMAEPYDTENVSLLPVFDSSKEELVPIWRDLIRRVGLEIKMGETVEKVAKGKDGIFAITSNVGAYQARRVVLATGTRGKPRTLAIAGENLPKVASLLEDPERHTGQTVCVVGGGDSALEAATALADAGARVILSYRGKSFSRAQPKNRQAVERYEAERRIKVKYESEVVEIAPDTVTLQMRDGTQKRYPNQALFVLIGADPPIEWLATMGIRFVERSHMHALPKSDALVRRFVADARPCPDRAEAAAALVQGRAVPQPVVESRSESRGRRLVRAASAVFGHQVKLDRPMPLSEFARQRRHDGRGRRDELDARERTRVLRMLRDEGGRLAEEDSKLFVIDRRSADRSDVAIVAQSPHGSPPPAHARPAPDRDPPPSLDPIETILPPEPTTASGDRSTPKRAVIVGLAKAQSRGATRKRPRPPEGGGVFDEPTRQISPENAAELLGARPDSHEEPTRFSQPLPLAPEPPAMPVGRRSPPPPPPAPARSTRRDDRPLAGSMPAPARRAPVVEEATVQVDFGTAQADFAAPAAPSAERTRPRLPPPSRRPVDDDPRGSPLGEIDWDLD